MADDWGFFVDLSPTAKNGEYMPKPSPPRLLKSAKKRSSDDLRKHAAQNARRHQTMENAGRGGNAVGGDTSGRGQHRLTRIKTRCTFHKRLLLSSFCHGSSPPYTVEACCARDR